MGSTPSEDQQQFFAGLFLLEQMGAQGRTYPVFLEGDQTYLEPILEWLMSRGDVSIVNNDHYAISPQGRRTLKQFAERYLEFLRFFDVFCAVDLGSGEFAFSHYFEFPHDEAWQQYLAEDRWEDLRVAVARHRGIDPVEIVFMSFLQEGRLGSSAEGWQFDLILGSLWDEIVRIVETALSADDLGYEDEQGVVSGDDVLRDVIVQGTTLMQELLAREGARPAFGNLTSFGGLRLDELKFNPDAWNN